MNIAASMINHVTFFLLCTGPPRNVHVLHNSEQPASVFSILESGTKTVPLIADSLFDLLMLKMPTLYTNKKQTKIESKGPRFEMADFLIKLGTVTMAQNFKGVLLEVGLFLRLFI
uniref:Mediator of RNA polymerase II transcription subunit 20 n=1 Tax=Trichogramma kaykai TaxID=54128 RepID=A0ABD2VYT1_9HYME